MGYPATRRRHLVKVRSQATPYTPIPQRASRVPGKWQPVSLYCGFYVFRPIILNSAVTSADLAGFL